MGETPPGVWDRAAGVRHTGIVLFPGAFVAEDRTNAVQELELLRCLRRAVSVGVKFKRAVFALLISSREAQGSTDQLTSGPSAVVVGFRNAWLAGRSGPAASGAPRSVAQGPNSSPAKHEAHRLSWERTSAQIARSRQNAQDHGRSGPR